MSGHATATLIDEVLQSLLVGAHAPEADAALVYGCVREGFVDLNRPMFGVRISGDSGVFGQVIGHEQRPGLDPSRERGGDLLAALNHALEDESGVIDRDDDGLLAGGKAARGRTSAHAARTIDARPILRALEVLQEERLVGFDYA